MILESNLTATTLLSLDRSILLKQPPTRYILPDYPNIYYLHRKQLFETGKPQACELRMVKNDGTTCWAHLESNVLRDVNSSPVRRKTMIDLKPNLIAEDSPKEVEFIDAVKQVGGFWAMLNELPPKGGTTHER